ncbi:hypothetical protein D3C85_1933860 [compost metagenome]
MGVTQEMVGIDAVMSDQSAESGAIAMPVQFAQAVRLVFVNLQVLHDVTGHPQRNQRK